MNNFGYNYNIKQYEVILMLTRFEVENYKNFKNKLTLSFDNPGGYKFNQDCLYNGIISKSMIYGRNASGKTNLGNAIMDMTDVLSYRNREQIIKNADSTDMITKFKYCFLFGDTEVEYNYEKTDEQTLTVETLLINEEKIYSVDYRNKVFISLNLSLVSAGTLDVKEFFSSLENMTDEGNYILPKVTFLRWIAFNSSLKKDSILASLVNFINRMYAVSVSSSLRPINSPMQRRLFQEFDDDDLREMEDFFSLMGIECKLKLLQMPEGEKKLYFDHQEFPVPFFETASSGTIALFNLYWRIVRPAKGFSLLFLDEYDAFYHYEMAENLFKYFKIYYPNTQIIFTTHNTNLMTSRLSRPDCLFILSLDGRITSLCDATERELREGHNLEKLYISGEFEDYE